MTEHHENEAEIALLRRISAFSAMSDAILAQLIAESAAVTFAADDRLMGQSEPGEFAIVLLAGAVSVVNESQHGRTALAQIAAPALVGEIAALARFRRTASIFAATPVRGLRVERAVLLEICRHSPEILLSVIGQLGQHIESTNHALGLYANGLSALERDDFDPALLEDLNNPIAEVKNFGDAFHRLAERIARERRNRNEMASAALIQRAMLPSNLDALPLRGRCAVHGDMRPARDVGGDFYDIFMLDDHHLALAIGDVCGKGVPASLFMSVTMTTLRLAATEQSAVLPMIERANALLCGQNPTMMFSTLFYGVLDLETGRFDYANCGHNPPFVRHQDGTWTQLAGGGAPLGIMPNSAIASRSLDLLPGEGIFLFTDGVTESIDASGGDYGEARLEEALRQYGPLGPAGLIDAVIADVERFATGTDQFDDITCVAAILP